jgi:acyl-CoA synthetase (AMP-forming)/AMP-acid ligase II
MIKTSGYRVSPTEIEEVLYNSQSVAETAVFGVPHPTLGQAVVAVVQRRPESTLSESALMDFCRDHLPAFMVPAQIHYREGALPRNPNGKIDRKSLSLEFAELFQKPKP